MSVLPQGTVTFLFTDVEGSTRLLHELGEGYAGALAEHRRVLRDAFTRHGGVEVDTQGDALFVAFAKASDALAGAAAGCEGLAGGPIRVRMGVHTGEPVVTDEGYVGIDVHRAARIAAAGHGGQILVSQSTRDLVGAVGLRDLGEHRLKDLLAPERIYQLGTDDFPPLKTLHTTNLPVAANPLVGREREVADLMHMLSDGARIVTLTGPGGSGKTRLGLQVAAELSDGFPSGVFFVPLADVQSADLVEGTIASTVGVRDLAELSERRVLVVVDNFEHVLDAASALTKVLAGGTAARILATSRAPLRLSGEQEFPVDPLPPAAAVELLTQRARSVRPDFEPTEAAAAICTRLDGLPLALELAASRLRSLDSDALLARLDKALPLLTAGQRDAPARQRTLRATIEWSYELLPLVLRELLARLAVFAGTFILESAEAVADATLEQIDALVEASLLKPIAGQRFLMLETIREFAAERLAELPLALDIERRHAEHYVEVARSTNLSDHARGKPRHELASAELPNFRKALAWAERARVPEPGLRQLTAMDQFWVAHDPFEARRWLEQLLELDGIDRALRARALLMYGGMVFIVGEFERGEEIQEQCLAEYRALGDEVGVANVLSRLIVPAAVRHEFEKGRSFAREGLEIYRRFGDKRGEAVFLGTLAHLEWEAGNHELAIELARDSAALADEVGFDWWRVGTVYMLCEFALQRGNVREAEDFGREALALAHRIGDRQHRIYLFALLARCAIETAGEERAGVLWSGVELEERQGPVGQWEDERDAYAAPVLTHGGKEFERGLERGRRKTIDELVVAALEE
jgi:predicted ATPase